MIKDQERTEDETTPAAVAPVSLWIRGRAPTQIELETGFTIVSTYVEQFWQSALGPTSVALLRYFARHRLPVGDDSTNYTEIGLEVTRAVLGVNRQGQLGKNGPLFRSIDRLRRFRFLTVDREHLEFPSHVTLSTHVHTVPRSIIEAWPAELRARHDAFIQQLLQEPPE